MDVIIAIFNQVFSMIKQFITAITPMAIYIYTVVSPLVKAFFLFMISIDYVSIFTSKIFISIILLILTYIGGYLYLKIYKPQLYDKIIDALGLKKRLDKHIFLFETDLDFKVSSD
jgi:hypothetical protein